LCLAFSLLSCAQVDFGSHIDCIEPAFEPSEKKGGITFNKKSFEKYMANQFDLNKSFWTVRLKRGRTDTIKFCNDSDYYNLPEAKGGKYVLNMFNIRNNCPIKFDFTVPDCNDTSLMFDVVVNDIIDTGTSLTKGSVSIEPKFECIKVDFSPSFGEDGKRPRWETETYDLPGRQCFQFRNITCGIDQSICVDIDICEPIPFAVSDSYNACKGTHTEIKFDSGRDRHKISQISWRVNNWRVEPKKVRMTDYFKYKDMIPQEYEVLLKSKDGCNYRKKHTIEEFLPHIKHDLVKPCPGENEGEIILKYPELIPDEKIVWFNQEDSTTPIAYGQHLENVPPGSYTAKISLNDETCNYPVKIFTRSAVKIESTFPDLGNNTGRIVKIMGQKSSTYKWSYEGVPIPNINLMKLKAGKYSAITKDGCITEVNLPECDGFDLIELLSPSIKKERISFNSFQRHLDRNLILVKPVEGGQCNGKVTKTGTKSFKILSGDCACFELSLSAKHELSSCIKPSIHCFDFIK